MYDTFGGFGSFFQAKKSYIDNTTFRLHYRVTFAILVLGSILVTIGQFIGSPILCMSGDPISSGMLNTYCWIHGTFTIPARLTGRIGEIHANPGVGPRNANWFEDVNVDPRYVDHTVDPNDKNLIGVLDNGEEIRHTWYQWVCLVLFLQAALCYFPHYLWKSWEGKKLEMLIQDLDKPLLGDIDVLSDRRKVIVNYIVNRLHTHNLYVGKFVLCEVLNLVNIVFQVCLMDVFLNGEFTKYGSDVIKMSELPIEERVDPMSKIFPKVAKCTFQNFGPSGSLEVKDGFCVLATNIINEKIYIFLWFWFMTLIVWSSIHLLLRFISIIWPGSRVMLLSYRSRANKPQDVKDVVEQCQFGDWFLLMQMSKHVHPAVFHEIIIEVKEGLEKK